MKTPATSGMILVAVVLTLGGMTPSPASARITSALLGCQEAIAEQATRFVHGLLTLERRCREDELATPGSCGAPDPGRVDKLRTILRTRITKRCDLGSAQLGALGFPGPCPEPVSPDGVTVEDLVACIDDSHTAGAGAIGGRLVGPTIVGPLSSGLLACQRAIDRAGIRFASRVLPAVQKCRNRILRGKIIGVQPADCATKDPRTSAIIDDCTETFRKAVTARCTSADLIALGVCAPIHVTVGGMIDCLIADIRRLIDNPAIADPPDLIDYEYARPRVCGDNRRNRAAEECDGVDDADCPGRCGAPDGLFGCLCPSGPRLQVVEHAHADLDLGASGHDFHVAEGGGYVSDLWDCDGATDFECTLGPSCSSLPHVSCGSSFGAPYTNGDAICAALGMGTCRKTRAGANGPHCEIDHQQECAANAQCPTFGDRCVTVSHAPPLPLSQGGVSVCIESRFTEDVTGTMNLATGAGAVRARQRLAFHIGGAIDQPCPVCGGFCAAPIGFASHPDGRSRCDHDGDCPGSFCVTEPICSYGPNADRPCRANPPFGGLTDHFGNPSRDCPPSPNQSVGDLDLFFNPQITAPVTLTAARDCMDPGFRDRACIGGANDQRPCFTDTDCPAGSCAGQCFCPGQRRPNSCHAACVGGFNDASPCIEDSECDPPSGFCHPADCRPDPSDTDSIQEGYCTVGPANGTCSANAQCFVNGTIQRAGTPGIPERTTAAAFCLAGTSSPAVDGTWGLPGPGALTQPETLVTSGF